VGSKTYHLPNLFLVMATQNPIEQEGTYPLPEAQLDRFLLYVKIDFPDAESEHQILQLARLEAKMDNERCLSDGPRISSGVGDNASRLTQQQLFAAREEVLSVHMSETLEKYLLELVLSTRNPKPYGEDIAYWVQYGASPRASIALDRCARAHAWIQGRDFVDPEDVQTMAYDVLRHRILLSYEAEAEGVNSDRFIAELIARIPLP
jgi:MoxR-like ATPase